MTIAALYACLNELASAIEAQKQVLKDLERSRCAVLRQLNDLRDPVSRLPLEIASEIFMQCLPVPDSGSDSHPSDAPLLLLNVCSSWTDIALHNSALWANLRISAPRDPELTMQFREHLSGWLGRTRDSPMCLSITGHTDHGVATIMARHAVQFQKLDLHLASAVYLELFQIEGSFPNLTSLFLGPSFHQDDYGPYSEDEIVKIFQATPNLTECTLDNRYYWVSGAHRNGFPMTHFRLQSLKIQGDSSSALVLQYLTLPALHTLSVAASDTELVLAPFLERSLPCLERLTLGLGGEPDEDAWSLGIIEDCFVLAATLTHLQLSGPHSCLDPFFDVLSRPALLPNLVHLAITICRTLPMWPPRLLDVLATRAGVKLRAVELEWKQIEDDSQLVDQIPAGDLTGLRALVSDGLEIRLRRRWLGVVTVQSVQPSSSI